MSRLERSTLKTTVDMTGCQSMKRFLTCEQRVKHAEYERDVLDYNPIGLDSEGDEVDEGDEEHIDPDVTDENPYGLVHLEGERYSRFRSRNWR